MTLDADVAAKAKQTAGCLGIPFKTTVNEALRIGLDQMLKPPAGKPYRTRARPLGLQAGYSYDNIGDLLAQTEGEDFQ